jgi:hypothetical protein
MKQILLESFKYVLYYKNITKIIPLPNVPINFNPFNASLNLYKFIEIVIKFLRL